MDRKLAIGAVMLVMSLLACADHAAAGQAQTTGSVVGRVTDESGGILPGVTVTAASPALQIPQVTDVTDGQGDYRLTPLPIGTYEVAYTLPGFQTVRRDSLRLTGGFVARVDVVLKVGAIEESVTVSATPTIDVQSTGSVTVLTRETLEVVPSSRAGIITLMNQSPSVELDPIPWTPSERWIRWHTWDQARPDDGYAGSFLRSSGSARSDWSWTRGRLSGRPHVTSI